MDPTPGPSSESCPTIVGPTQMPILPAQKRRLDQEGLSLDEQSNVDDTFEVAKKAKIDGEGNGTRKIYIGNLPASGKSLS